MGSGPVPVVCIHGLWMNGMEMAWLRRELGKRHGFEVAQFSYHTVSEGMAENTLRLGKFIDDFPADSVHLVGHSLGGVLALQTLKRYPNRKVARVVCLGSPLVDSRAARNLSRWSWGRAMVSKTLREAVLENPLQSADPNHEVGVIGGTLGLGLGMLAGHLEKPHDGVVTETETRLAGLTDHLMLGVNHIGLVLSRKVAAQAAKFLSDGRFDRD
jgi:pimeloyl-ACP methyl ester carboxylesterase